MPTSLRILYRVVFDAIWHFSEDDGWAMASHVALSTLLALFPFLIFGTALASFLGADQFADTAVHLIFDTWPPSIAEPISREVVAVLTIPRGGLLTLSVLAAAYFASNGVEALRVSLNRAYRVAETRYWYMTRLASLGFVVVGVLALVVISIALVAVPIAVKESGTWLPWLTYIYSVVQNWGIMGTIIVLFVGLLIAHLWMPAGHRRIMDVLPGIILTLLAWSIGAYAFARYLAAFATYVTTYAGLASIMVALVFLYIVGVIFILGAEINAAILKYRVKHIIRDRFREPREQKVLGDKGDELSDTRKERANIRR
ncbi:YihY/virulence factor BrkB family protein [Sinorhizobium sp. BG8]|uniref:YihY/virulence factor BrkB family protein n=1 Tax=Sinorhizobium sp. BG8 TaxID=2613773 RepID=UPI00193CC1E0|nr:YihY/virulence factor BrkB family protein [Sinorhizobium sp. BG8]QRM53395.1 YihY/virulence factor BrkB family protein [Sinorhizobium sp. BG8]